MKLLYLSTDLGIPVLGGKGGAVHIRSMVSAFSRAGHEVVLVAPSTTKSPWESPARLDGQLLQIPPRDEIKDCAMALKSFHTSIAGSVPSLAGQVRRILYDQQLVARLIRKFDSHSPDAIYERYSTFSTAGVRLAEAIQRPLVMELNAPLAAEQAEYRGSALDTLAKDAERWTLTRADAVLAVSEEVAEYAISVGVPRDRVHVVPNGVDTQYFHSDRGDVAATKQRWDLADRLVLGFVGGLKPWHGVEALPDLLASLSSSIPNLCLLIVGDGPMRAELEQRCAFWGLLDRVRFTGNIPHEQVGSLIRAMDLAVAPYPTLRHAFYFSPLKLFEYMACGTAVVVPAIGQMADIVQHEKTGLLYDPHQPTGLEHQCQRLLKDMSLRSRLGHAAAKLVQDAYTWDRNADRVTGLVHSLRTMAPQPTHAVTS